MGKTYKIENTAARPTGFRVRGGIETVATNQTRTLELADELSEARIEQFKAAGINISSSSGKAENSLGKKTAEVTEPEKPAETGGIKAQSSVSERGGVDRAKTDSFTTTKPTEKQTGAKA